MSSRSAAFPVCAPVDRVRVAVFVPKPPCCQQSATSPPAGSASRPGFGARLRAPACATARLSGGLVVGLPDRSVARAAICTVPFVTVVLSQTLEYGAAVADATT
jgi:hypothetical protein